MPPFGDEPSEPTPKPLSFLSLRHASSKRRPVQNRVFGAEPAEACDADVLGTRAATVGKSRPQRPFQDEDDEGSSTAKPIKDVKHELTPGPFGDEGDEDEGNESEDDASQSSDDNRFIPQQNTVFSFGWASVSTLQKATFWKENLDDANAKRQKRVYDNTKRAAEAAYTRRKTKGVYKRNGLDPARLQKLFATARCQCACVGIQFLFSHWLVTKLNFSFCFLLIRFGKGLFW